MLRVITVRYVVSGLGRALSWNLESLMVFRVIDRLGRKPLLLIGTGGMGVALAGVAAIYASGAGQALPMSVGFIIFLAISQGAVIWVHPSAIFPEAKRVSLEAMDRAVNA